MSRDPRDRKPSIVADLQREASSSEGYYSGTVDEAADGMFYGFRLDDAPVERPRPDYRLVLVFDPANDLNSDTVCQGKTRFGAPRPGVFYAYAIYCRNDQAMSQTTAWTSASGPTDPRIGQLFRELFQVVFSDSPALRPQMGHERR